MKCDQLFYGSTIPSLDWYPECFPSKRLDLLDPDRKMSEVKGLKICETKFFTRQHPQSLCGTSRAQLSFSESLKEGSCEGKHNPTSSKVQNPNCSWRQNCLQASPALDHWAWQGPAWPGHPRCTQAFPAAPQRQQLTSELSKIPSSRHTFTVPGCSSGPGCWKWKGVCYGAEKSGTALGYYVWAVRHVSWGWAGC